ncbi:hypothetical protein TBLA_0I00490 [Henningerozyma blattae CBS 6284]|uniref:COX assembly mitochondrial protein n=1 Tax=Henningerozyma blattae (strain ATCC 34711 / CBS 6284 / DSM 70876 / NBRC 10599 / NRRL Y-10934 / UCD 77-7) TaxID=1071380 RepID=I2H8K8_HENB6|nr:hypothetical protein TBLA_0I00490 [Tetrapisispora blattae CBS 6284]CCH62710.1 hypothetical protein TBLA_0I00490 [Tetrapisispora blattae CBS 6284]
MQPDREAAKHTACAHYARLLEECHNSSYARRMLGACNNEKDALSACMRQFSHDYARQRLANARENAAAKNANANAWDDLERDEALLRQLVEREKAKRNS